MNELEIADTLASFKESQDATCYALQSWLRSNAAQALIRLADCRKLEHELFAVILAGIQTNKKPGFQPGHGDFKRKRVMPNGDAGNAASEAAQ